MVVILAFQPWDVGSNLIVVNLSSSWLLENINLDKQTSGVSALKPWDATGGLKHSQGMGGWPGYSWDMGARPEHARDTGA